MRYLPEFKEKIRRVIRDAKAADPLITIGAIQRLCEQKFNRTFTPRYIKKLAEKVFRQSIIEADRTQIQERLNVTREKFRLASERLLEIIQWKPDPNLPPEFKQHGPYNEDVIEAAKNFAMLDMALLKAEIDCGMYKKPLDAVTMEVRYQPLPPEVRMVIVNSLRNFDLLPSQMIERAALKLEHGDAHTTIN
jgi:hypothetical protein